MFLCVSVRLKMETEQPASTNNDSSTSVEIKSEQNESTTSASNDFQKSNGSTSNSKDNRNSSGSSGSRRDRDRSSRSSSSRRRSRSPSSRGRNEDRSSKVHRRVYVANIPFDVKWGELKDLFRDKVGNVRFCTLFENEEGKPRGCGLVEFDDSSYAKKAIDLLNRYNFKGRELVVKEDLDIERDRYGRLITSSRERGLDERRGRGGDRGGGGGGHDLARRRRCLEWEAGGRCCPCGCRCWEGGRRRLRRRLFVRRGGLALGRHWRRPYGPGRPPFYACPNQAPAPGIE